MKILILGSGAVGGYFGGRLVEIGADVTFFVRKKRASLIKTHGLRIDSPHGNLKISAKTITFGEAKQNFDIAILTCKAYDLKSSLDDLNSVLLKTPFFLPLLNGISHIDYLRKRFGKDKILGGAAHVASVLTFENVIKQLNPIQILTVGAIEPETHQIATKFLDVCKTAKFKTINSDDILQALWDKWIFLATLAGSTTLFDDCVGKITSTSVGENLMKSMYIEALSIAEKENQKVGEKAQVKALEILMKPSSDFTSSMLRDLRAKKPTEHEHILGDLVRFGLKNKLNTPLLSSAYINISMKKNN